MKCTDDRTWSVVGNPEYTDQAMICRITKCAETPPVKANAQYFMHHGNHYNVGLFALEMNCIRSSGCYMRLYDVDAKECQGYRVNATIFLSTLYRSV